MSPSPRLYELILLAGVFGAVYLYAFAFDDYSETELVRLSYVWVAAIAFGSHGLIASEVGALRTSGAAETVADALKARSKEEGRSVLSRVASLMVWSYLPVQRITGGDRPLLVAVAAAGLWAAALAFFFEAIFPGL